MHRQPSDSLIPRRTVAGLTGPGYARSFARETRNPKYEIRNKSKGPKGEMTKTEGAPLRFELSSLCVGFVSDFVLRITDFARACHPMLNRSDFIRCRLN